jgi:hypothetical protein
MTLSSTDNYLTIFIFFTEKTGSRKPSVNGIFFRDRVALFAGLGPADFVYYGILLIFR